MKFKKLTKEEVIQIIENGTLPESEVKINGKASRLHQEFEDFEEDALKKIFYKNGIESMPEDWHSKNEAIAFVEDYDNFCKEVDEDEDFDFEI